VRAGVIAAWLLLVLGVWPLGAMAQSGQASCSSFPNQAAAQAAYRANPAALASLDRDHDGVACESLPCPCDPPRAASSGSATSSAPASATSAPAYIFVAPTLPPQPTGLPSSVRWAPAAPRGSAALGAPAALSNLAGSLPPAPPRESPPDPPPAPATSRYPDLADIWTGRDGVLVVQADGQAQALWWAPRACPADAADGCAPAAELTGRATLALRWRDESRIVAEVETTTQESALPRGVAILRLRPDGVLELWPAGQEGYRAYCNERLWREQPAVAQPWCGSEAGVP